MSREFRQIDWDDRVERACRRVIRAGLREDLAREYDWTTVSLVPEGASGRAALVSRAEGIVAGLAFGRAVLDEMDSEARWTACVEDGARVEPGFIIARMEGPARDLLTGERTILNGVTRLSGIATLTGRFVDAVLGTRSRIYDTRKTTSGWRLLEKYAVRCGGGVNHREGLFAAVLIKDNHLAFGAGQDAHRRFTPAEAVAAARRFIQGSEAGVPNSEVPNREMPNREMIIEIEVDSIEQLEQVLPVGPDVVLLDNMSPEQLSRAVALRDEENPNVELEASGGVDLASVRVAAESGVDRISVGALTHSPRAFDVGLDWG